METAAIDWMWERPCGGKGREGRSDFSHSRGLARNSGPTDQGGFAPPERNTGGWMPAAGGAKRKFVREGKSERGVSFLGGLTTMV